MHEHSLREPGEKAIGFLCGTKREYRYTRFFHWLYLALIPIGALVHVDLVWVLADLYEQDLAMVAVGAPVTVRVPAYAGETFAGKVDHVGEVLDPMTHTVKLRCLVPNPEKRLKPEMFARVEIAAAAASKAILLPSRAILTDSRHTRVLRVIGRLQMLTIVRKSASSRRCSAVL